MLLFLRYAQPAFGAKFVFLYIELFQGTPLLLTAVSSILRIAPTGYRDLTADGGWSCAYPLCGGVSRRDLARLRGRRSSRTVGGQRRARTEFLAPDARCNPTPGARIALPPTVGFLVQLVKATALVFHRRLQRSDESRHDRQQRDLSAIPGLWAGCADLFRNLLSAYDVFQTHGAKAGSSSLGKGVVDGTQSQSARRSILSYDGRVAECQQMVRRFSSTQGCVAVGSKG